MILHKVLLNIMLFHISDQCFLTLDNFKYLQSLGLWVMMGLQFKVYRSCCVGEIVPETSQFADYFYKSILASKNFFEKKEYGIPDKPAQDFWFANLKCA